MKSKTHIMAVSLIWLIALAGQSKAQELSADELKRRAIERRAVDAVIWGMPAVNAELMFQAMRDAKADFNQVVYWSRPLTWKNQTLTPNPDTIYLMPFFTTKEAGPMVLEIPPAGEEGSITYFRLYGPTQPYFDKTWALPDIEEMK
jgi:hypothetical protein